MMKDKMFAGVFATGLAAVFLLGFSAPVRADEGKGASVKMSGEFRTRGFYTSDLLPPGTDGKDTEAFGDLRFRLRTTVTSEVATGVIVADFTNGFCSPSVATVQSNLPLDQGNGKGVDDVFGFCAPGQASTGNARFGTGTAFGHSLNIVGIREAYIKVHLKNFGAVAGRKHYLLGHGLVLDDTATGVGVRAHFSSMTLTVADLNLADPLAGAGLAGTSNDSDLYLIKLTDPSDPSVGYGKEKYSIYIGHVSDPKGNLTYKGFGTKDFGAGFHARLNIIGASLKQYTYRDGGPVIDVEVNSFSGDIVGAANPHISGIAALAGVSVPMNRDNVKAKAGLTVVYGSGQDPAKDPAKGGGLNINALSGNYSLGNILLDTSVSSDRDGGSLDVGQRGIIAVKVSTDCAKDEKRSLGVALIWAKTAQDASLTNTSRNLGVELDGNATIKLDENLELASGVGYLIAGDAWKAFNSSDASAIKLHMAVVLTF